MMLISGVVPVCPCQVLKVSQVSQEALDVQGLTVPKEREETLGLEANLDHKVNQTWVSADLFQTWKSKFSLNKVILT